MVAIYVGCIFGPLHQQCGRFKTLQASSNPVAGVSAAVYLDQAHPAPHRSGSYGGRSGDFRIQRLSEPNHRGRDRRLWCSGDGVLSGSTYVAMMPFGGGTL